MQHDDRFSALRDSIIAISADYPGEIGIGIIIGDADTLAINDAVHYPMMSVYKLHQAIALCDVFDRCGWSLDSMVNIERSGLNKDTWSPMMREHSEDIIEISIADLLRYSLISSDNNASNYLFERFVDTHTTDSVIAGLIPRQSFGIAYTEEEMWHNHNLAYDNFTTPTGAAMLINRLYTEGILSAEKQSFIQAALGECSTGTDRIVAPLIGIDSVTVGHKTGSGYRDERGLLAAHNDVAFVTLPGGRHYALAIFVTNFDGDEAQASEVMARISAVVYAALNDLQKPNNEL